MVAPSWQKKGAVFPFFCLLCFLTCGGFDFSTKSWPRTAPADNAHPTPFTFLFSLTCQHHILNLLSSTYARLERDDALQASVNF